MRLSRKGARAAAGATIAALALQLAACGGGERAQGGSTANCPPRATEPIQGDTIKIGASAALSGPSASLGDFAYATQAYFDRLNQQGGVDTVAGKKRIEFIVMDDQYKPSRTQQNVRELVQREEVDLITSIAGTPTTLAVAPYLNQQCVPLAWPAAFTRELTGDEWPFVSIASTYHEQAVALGRWVTQQVPNGRIAVLYQNDDLGREQLAGLEEALAGSGAQVVESQSYETTDTSIRSQMTTLAASGADLFFIAGSNPKCEQSMIELGNTDWAPTVLTSISCGGAITAREAPPSVQDKVYFTAQFKNTNSPDPAVASYTQLMETAGLDQRSTTQLGYTYAQLVEATLSSAQQLTQVGIAQAAWQLPPEPPENTLLRDGIPFTPARGEPALSDYVIARWDPARDLFLEEGPVISGGPQAAPR